MPAVIGFGSSPHTRGTSINTPPCDADQRFIPAHAGNMVFYNAKLRKIPVHPRTRGEHVISLGEILAKIGSSPHTRGTSPTIRPHRIPRRFIPAHAGNMGFRSAGRSRVAVHPRTRGEHRYTRPGSEHEYGSSPHTRGTYLAAIKNIEEERFIPAHAGNIFDVHSLTVFSSVHPRTRGEHITPLIRVVTVFGSSPHTRGT